jgi:CubicO group peptidase (beta-lactamase class C family)
MEKIVQGRLDITPREARYDESRIALLASHYLSKVEAGTLQGASFLMARDGKVFAHQAMGKLTYLPDSAPLLPDSIKSIASITKVVTAAAVMKLVEDGVVWLQQPVKTIIKEFDTQMHGSISLWHLLTHTSGLRADGGYFTEPYPVDDHGSFGEKDWLVKTVLSGPLQNAPGEQWNYCSNGFAVLAEVVTRASGMHFNDYVAKKIFEPLGMSRSFIEVPEALEPEVILLDEWTKKHMAWARTRVGAPMGAGGVYSTLRDLFKFGQCFLGGGEYGGARILGRKTVQEMTRNQLCGVPSFHWGARCREYRHGLGWGFFCDGSTVGPATFNHEGWGWCSLYVDPVERFIFASFVPDPEDWNPQLVVAPRTIAFSGIL